MERAPGALRRALLVAVAVIVGLTVSPAAAAESDPPAPRLLRWSDVTAGMRGAFVVPESTAGEFRFGYSSGIHTQLGNGDLLVDGHPYFDRTARVRVPASLDGAPARRVGPWTDLTGGLLPRGWIPGSESFDLGGLLQVGRRLWFTKHQWYNGTGSDWDSQGFRRDGVVHGLWNVGLPAAHSQRVGGYLSPAPAALRDRGVTYLAGQEGQSGAATGRWGPNLFAVDAQRLPARGAALGARPLMFHDAAHPAPGWWVAHRIAAMQWIETSRVVGVLAFGYEGYGVRWYGEFDGGPDGVTSPYADGKGYFAAGYRLCAYLYDPQDLLAVYRGDRRPWSVRPVWRRVLTERAPGSGTEEHRSFVTGPAKTLLNASVRDGRLILLQADGAFDGEPVPKGYVIDLPGS